MWVDADAHGYSSHGMATAYEAEVAHGTTNLARVLQNDLKAVSGVAG